MKGSVKQPPTAAGSQDLTFLFEDGLVAMVGVTARVRAGAATLAKERPDLAPELNLARKATDKFVAGLAELVDVEGDTDDVADRVVAATDLVACYADELYGLDGLPLDDPDYVSLPASLTVAIPGPTLFQMAPPPPPSSIDLEVLIRILDELILFLDRLLRSWTKRPGGQIRLAEATGALHVLRTYRMALFSRLALGSGQRIGVRAVLRALRPMIYEFMANAGRFVGRAELRAVGARLATFIRGLGPAAGIGGSQAGAASVALLNGIVLAILAAYAGYWLGRVIGNTRVGDRTIDEHLGDYFTVLYETYAGPCQVPLGQFTANFAARRGVEALDDPPEALVRFYLKAEIEDLDRLIANECDGRVGFWQRLRDQRAARLEELDGGR